MMDNHYMLEKEAQQRTSELQVEAETHRLGKARDLNLDSRHLPKALVRLLYVITR